MKAEMVAKRYAKALYDLAKEEGLESKIGQELEQITLIIEKSAEFSAVVESPLYDINLKKQILADIIARASISAYVANLLNLLLEKDRFMHVADIRTAYMEMLDAASGKIKAVVTSAVDLSEAQQQRIAEALSRAVNKEVAVDVSVDPAIIGGVIADIQGMIYDGSVRTQIAKLKQGLKGEI